MKQTHIIIIIQSDLIVQTKKTSEPNHHTQRERERERKVEQRDKKGRLGTADGRPLLLLVGEH